LLSGCLHLGGDSNVERWSSEGFALKMGCPRDGHIYYPARNVHLWKPARSRKVMSIPKQLQDWLENSEFIRTINEKSTFTVFFSILAGLVTSIGIVGKIWDKDKAIALWISHATVINPITKDPELRTTTIIVVLFGVFVLSGFALLLIWTFQHRFAKTSDQVALNEFMGSVRQIRDQGMQTKIKAWDQITLRYLINKDFTGVHSKTLVMRAVDHPVHYWESVNTVEDEADSAESLASINYRVEDMTTPSINSKIVYLPSENGKRLKKACLFFLPPIEPNQVRTFNTFYEWKGMFKRLKTTSEDLDYSTHTRDILPSFCMEVYLEEGTGKRLECAITGDTYKNQKIESRSYSSNGWKGSGFIYTVTDIPPGNLHLVLRIELKS
jgi:hypothetical protein